MYPNLTFATADHNTPTINQHLPIKDPLSAKQLQTLQDNTKKHDIVFWGLGHKKRNCSCYWSRIRNNTSRDYYRLW